MAAQPIQQQRIERKQKLLARLVASGFCRGAIAAMPLESLELIAQVHGIKGA